jgi:hypothetical protein
MISAMMTRGFIRKLRGDCSGNVLMLGAVTLPLVVGAAGLGLDSIQWTLMQRQMQRAADSAAMAGALAKTQGFDGDQSARDSIARANPLPDIDPAVDSDSFKVEDPPKTGSYAGKAEAVRVVMQTRMPLPFSGLFLNTGPLIRAEATATAVNNYHYCVLALIKYNINGIKVSGSSDITMDCGMATNSTAASAVTTANGTRIDASPVAAVGGLKASASYAPGTKLLPYSAPQADPFAALPDPSLPSKCSPELKVQPSSNVTISANNNCFNGVSIKGTVTFSPGVYYISGKTFDIGSQGTLIAEGVTFILMQPSFFSPSQLNISAGATVQISAPTSGTYAGVMFYQDRRSTLGLSNVINGNSSSSMRGAFYFPRQAVKFGGATGIDTQCLQIVSQVVEFTGGTTIQNTCPTDSGAHDFSGTRVFLVE